MLMRYAHPMWQRIIAQMDKRAEEGLLGLEPPLNVSGTLQKTAKASEEELLLGFEQQ